MATKCDRCGKEAYYLEACLGCEKKVCRDCQKSSLTASKTKRLVICKTCWGKMPIRKKYLSA